jgi:hypothetical protein
MTRLRTARPPGRSGRTQEIKVYRPVMLPIGRSSDRAVSLTSECPWGQTRGAVIVKANNGPRPKVPEGTTAAKETRQ